MRREHLDRERELAAYAARLARRLMVNPGYGALMARKSRENRHSCRQTNGGRERSRRIVPIGADGPKLTSSQVASKLGVHYVKPPFRTMEKVG